MPRQGNPSLECATVAPADAERVLATILLAFDSPTIVPMLRAAR